MSTVTRQCRPDVDGAGTSWVGLQDAECVTTEVGECGPEAMSTVGLESTAEELDCEKNEGRKEERSRRLEDRKKNMKKVEAQELEEENESLLSSQDVSTRRKKFGKDQEAWTPIRVRKERLGLIGNLGLSPKSFKVMKIGKPSPRTKCKPRNGGEKVSDISSLFEGASEDRTLADIELNPCRTNPLAVQDKPLGQLYRVDRCTPVTVIGQAGAGAARPEPGQLYQAGGMYLSENCDWPGGRRGSNTRCLDANFYSPFKSRMNCHSARRIS